MASAPKGLRRVEAEGVAGDEADARIAGLDAGVGEPVLDRGDDAGALLGGRIAPALKVGAARSDDMCTSVR